jgi:hypothetical protein
MRVYDFKIILLLYIFISIPRFAGYFLFTEVEFTKYLFEIFFLFLVLLLSKIKIVVYNYKIEKIFVLIASIIFLYANYLGIDTLERMLILIFAIYYIYNNNIINLIIPILIVILSTYLFGNYDNIFYGDNFLSKFAIDIFQNLTAWIFFIIIIFNRLISKVIIYLYTFILFFIILNIYFIDKIFNLHIRYNIDNIIEIIFSKFYMRFDWMWAIKNNELDNSNLSQILFDQFDFVLFIQRFFSPLQYPLRYFFDISLWDPWELAKQLSINIRGFGSFNLDAATWSYFSVANTFEGFIAFIVIYIIMLIGILRLKYVENNVFNNYVKILILSFGISIAYQDRDLKIIFILSLLFFVSLVVNFLYVIFIKEKLLG